MFPKDTAKGTIFADAGVKAALFGKNAVAVGDGSFRQVSVKMGDSSYFVVLGKVLSRTPAKSENPGRGAPLLETAFADSYRSHMMQTSADSLKKAFGMQLEKIKIPDGRKYYEAHKNLFKTKQGFEVYRNVENGDSAALAKAIDKPLMLSDFKALATSMSTNDSTRGTKAMSESCAWGSLSRTASGRCPVCSARSMENSREKSRL